MKEVEKNEIKRLSDRLDAIRHQQAELSLVEAADKYAELEKEKATLEAEIARLREVHSQKLSKEAQKLMKMPFRQFLHFIVGQRENVSLLLRYIFNSDLLAMFLG